MKKGIFISIFIILISSMINCQEFKRILWFPPLPYVSQGKCEVLVADRVLKKYLGCSYRLGGEEVDLEVKEISFFSSGKATYILPDEVNQIAFVIWDQKITPDIYGHFTLQEREKYNISHENAMKRFREIGYFMFGRIEETGWLTLVSAEEAELGAAFGVSIYP